MRLIDADALTALEELEYYYKPVCDGKPWYKADDVWDCIDKQPTIVLKARRKGRCKFCEDLDRMCEVVCYLPNDNGGATDISLKYCPNCGAKMEG